MQQPAHDALMRALAHPRFEVVPMKGVEEQIAHLPPGAKVTVTCSPTRGLDRTLLLAERLAEQGLRVVPHISARLVIDRSHLAAILRRLADLEMREIFVIGGDARQPAGSFPSALDLLQAMAGLKHAVEQIGIAGYPENHPLVDRRILQQALLEKQPFATYIVTQICFNPKVITAWLAGMRQSGITLPVYIGLPGAVDLKRLLRISMKIGVGDSTRFLAKNTGLAARLFKPVGYEPTDLVEALAPSLSSPELDIQGFHLNTFNQVDGTERWRQRMLKTHAVQRAV